MKLNYIKASAVRKAVKLRYRRTSKEFLMALDEQIKRTIEKACSDHNGGRVTLDSGIAYMYTGVSPMLGSTSKKS
jgi:hypothetical protein